MQGRLHRRVEGSEVVEMVSEEAGMHLRSGMGGGETLKERKRENTAAKASQGRRFYMPHNYLVSSILMGSWGSIPIGDNNFFITVQGWTGI